MSWSTDKRLKVQDILASPSSWNKYSTALDSEGQGTCSQYHDAVSWCLMGAIIKCYGGPEEKGSDSAELQFVCNKVTKKIGQGIMGWNDADERTHEQVLALCEELEI